MIAINNEIRKKKKEKLHEWNALSKSMITYGFLILWTFEKWKKKAWMS